jgi:hypothetical protein
MYTVLSTAYPVSILPYIDIPRQVFYKKSMSDVRLTLIPDESDYIIDYAFNIMSQV